MELETTEGPSDDGEDRALVQEMGFTYRGALIELIFGFVVWFASWIIGMLFWNSPSSLIWPVDTKLATNS